jgi:outer membrane lipoprotein-sorting protein
MRRTRWHGLLAVALTSLLLSVPTQAVAGTQETSSAKAKVVALSADQQVTRTSRTASGAWQTTKSTTHFYRDSENRTRAETPTAVTISDPASRTTLRLDPATRTYRSFSSADQQRRPDSQTDGPSTRSRDLGTSVISGVAVQGRQDTVTIPASDKQPAATAEVTLWLSPELRLPIQTRTVYPDGRDETTTYTNIRLGAQPAGLFAAPAGYREGNPVIQGVGTSDAGCPLNIYWDPSVAVSIRPWGGSGLVAAISAQDPCIFVGDRAAAEIPLLVAPLTPLGLPEDIWLYFDDTITPVPWSGWVSYGFVTFLAAGPDGTTLVSALFTMVIFT